jgi:unspecific monooxygenase
MEKAPWSLISRAKAFKSIEEFDRIIDGIIENTTTMNTEKEPTILVSHLLKDALDSGQITHLQYRSNLRITFMVGHDNIEFLLLSAMWVLGKDTVSAIIKL